MKAPISVSISLDAPDGSGPVALRFKEDQQYRYRFLTGKEAAALGDQLRRATALLGVNGKPRKRRRRRKVAKVATK